MQKMRVSTMKIVKKGQEEKRTERAMESPRDTPQRASLRARMQEVARKQEERIAQMRRTFEDGSQRRERPARAGAKGSGRAHDAAGPGARRPWRYDFLVQTGVCAVILLSVLGFQAVDTPLTNQITDGIGQMVTMEVDLGKDLGRLQFVRNIVPPSVLTFWENTADEPASLLRPIAGSVALEYSERQPGIVFTGTAPEVFCAADGVVESVTRGDDGDYMVKIRHDGGIDTVYGLLQGVKVAVGDAVSAGQEIALAMPGRTGSHLYFQALRAGKAFDPTELLAL